MENNKIRDVCKFFMNGNCKKEISATLFMIEISVGKYFLKENVLRENCRFNQI